MNSAMLLTSTSAPNPWVSFVSTQLPVAVFARGLSLIGHRRPRKNHCANIPRFDSCSWRAYVRDPRAPIPRTLDTALLLCEGHGLLITPPHVEEFLAGNRRYLLGGLDPDRSGCVCEVLTPEEWDALTLVRTKRRILSHQPTKNLEVVSDEA